MAHQPPTRRVIQPVIQQPAQSVDSGAEAPSGVASAKAAGPMENSGFVRAASIIRPGGKFRRLMLGLTGLPGSGKSEFAMSGPGPGAHVVLDRGIDAALNNQNPPETRSDNWRFKIIRVPKETQLSPKPDAYLPYWKEFFHQGLLPALDSTDARTVVLDGDADSWELQKLATWGRTTKVMSFQYTEVNTARRALYARCYDSAKLFVSISRAKKNYVPVLDANGKKMVDDFGKEVREWDGAYERDGFDDQEYVWQILLMNLYDEANQTYGFRFLRCKPNMSLNGQEFWGADCNMPTMLQVAFPHVPLSEWGY